MGQAPLPHPLSRIALRREMSRDGMYLVNKRNSTYCCFVLAYVYSYLSVVVPE
jgi:hypothetical protein